MLSIAGCLFVANEANSSVGFHRVVGIDDYFFVDYRIGFFQRVERKLYFCRFSGLDYRRANAVLTSSLVGNTGCDMG